MFEFLAPEDATRAAEVIETLQRCGFPGSLTGSLAIRARLCARGHRPAPRRIFRDVDFVADGFAALPESLADSFLVSHVHPFAPEGKLLLQLVDRRHALRVDVFRAFGRTLRCAHVFAIGTRPLSVVALEDLVARMTSHVFGHLIVGRSIERKYVETLLEFLPFREELPMDEAWQDHRQAID
jgi:hypothetical protein